MTSISEDVPHSTGPRDEQVHPQQPGPVDEQVHTQHPGPVDEQVQEGGNDSVNFTLLVYILNQAILHYIRFQAF